MKNNILFWVFFTLILTSCSKEEVNSTTTSEDDFSAAVVLKNIPYGEGEAQEYDLYLPSYRSAENTKGLVFIHGGGWIQGDKSDMEAYIYFRKAIPLMQ